MLMIIAGTFCMLLAFSSMWLSWYVLMPHKHIKLDDGTEALGEVTGGKMGDIIEEEVDSILHHKHKAPKK
ncbi:hypothetical protein [Candidatus Nitrotoga sp. M5]|uniref:hypothetical protein n=1 Tax=Candidatus Nitrotoga sp. M5 TaxID=2890409 RepID=UPI001EF4C316|nr:hypothetical protein [Candidatus Nitrotoga sp. M5]CAH1388119.1 conserved hypothetical protein [Candidatus Nitrotoga sp. M5]